MHPELSILTLLARRAAFLWLAVGGLVCSLRADWEFAPGGAWETLSVDRTVAIAADGTPSQSAAGFSPFLQGSDKPSQGSGRRITFTFTAETAGFVGLEVLNVATWVGANPGVRISEGGVELGSSGLSGGATYERPVAAGALSVEFYSTGVDWIEVSRFYFREGGTGGGGGGVETPAPTVGTVALEHRVVVETGRPYYLELSTDLEPGSWEIAPLRLVGGVWSVSGTLGSPGVEIPVLGQEDLGGGVWRLTFGAPIGDRVFTRVRAVSGIPREDGTGFTYPVDPTVTVETFNLLYNLHRIGWSDQFMMGHEFPLSFTLDGSGDNDPTTSDIKDVVGDHPGVHGSDFHFMIDKGAAEIARHKAAARAAYEAGAVVTFDYHWLGRYGGSHDWTADDAQMAANVANGNDANGDVTWFYQHVDEVLAIINNDLKFPIVFRPFHEMDGNWFWWGSRIPGGAPTYRLLFQKLVDYMRERTDYVLFCWSPDVSNLNFQQYYPGNEYVDVVGRDIYAFAGGESRRSVAQLIATIDFAEANGKVAAFTETGYTAGGVSFETGFPTWWTQRVLNTLVASERGLKIAWVLTWINSSWSGPYVPHKGSPQLAKDDFVQFYTHPATLFEADVAALKVYELPAAEE